MVINERITSYLIRFLLGEDVNETCYETVGYTSNPKNFSKYKLVIVPSNFFKEEVYGTEASLPQPALKKIDGVPFLFGSAKKERVKDTLIIEADLIASTYFLITRYEEMVRRDVRDVHGRFPGIESLPHRAGFLNRPVVDEYRLLLRKWLSKGGVEIPKTKKEIEKIYLTHDLDEPTLFRTWRGAAHSLAAGRGLKQTWHDKFGPLEQNPYYTFPWLFEKDKMLKTQVGDRCQSILFVRSGGTEPEDKPHYKLKNKDIRTLLKYAEENGQSIGLHSSYKAGLRPKLVQREKRKLEKYLQKEITEHRHHYLRSREPEDLALLEAAGITDDFTMGYADLAGFRLGTSRPVRWINPLTRRLTGLTLHPLIVMDATLDQKKYMGLNFETARTLCIDLIEKIRKTNGQLVVLWHNTQVRADKDLYHRQLYAQLISYLCNE